jgi:hypothetical protein
MNQSSTRTLSKSYFALPKNDVISLVLAAAVATAVALGIRFFFFFFRVGFFFFPTAVNQSSITGAITAASGLFHFRLGAVAAAGTMSVSISSS